MATFTVTTNIDEGFDGGNQAVETADGQGLSIREAISLASAGDTINFDLGDDTTIRLSEDFDEILITKDITIDSGGVITITGEVDGDDVTQAGITVVNSSDGRLDDNKRILFATADLTLDGLTITGGNSGAVIIIGGNLAVRDSVLAGNNATLSGGALGIGSGVVTATIIDSEFIGIVARGSGGAIFSNSINSALEITGSTISENSTAGANAGGGGVYAKTAIVVSNSIILGNIAEQAYGNEVVADFIASSDGRIEVLGQNIIGADVFSFNTGANFTGSGAAQNAPANDVFAAAVDNNGAVAGVLADNGGGVQTVALRDDAANPALNTAVGVVPDADARGVLAVGGRDLGAFEVNPDNALIVTTTTDVVDADDGLISLREAVAIANDRDGADTITFAAGGQGLIRLTEGQIAITDELTIDGGGLVTITGDAGANDTTLACEITDVDATMDADNLDDNSQIFVATTDLTLDRLTLTGGNGTNGGAVFVDQGSLTLDGSVLSGNFAKFGSAVLLGNNADDSTITNSVFSDNAAGRNDGFGASGGGTINNNSQAGSLTITGSAITDNSAFDGGGGVTSGFSGASLTITDSTISDNTSGARGGGVYTEGLTTTISGSTISGNSSVGSGGGLYASNNSAFSEVTITGSTISNNNTISSGAKGGGIHAETSNLTITNSAVVGNYTTAEGSFGGGIYADGAFYGAFEEYSGVVSITNSTIANNETRGERGYGGGIFVDGGQLQIANSTITGNNALGALNDPDAFDIGAAIYSDNDITITNSIVTGNTAPTAGGPEVKEKDQSGRPSGVDDVVGNGVVTFEGSNIIGANTAAYDVSAIANAVNAAASDIFDGGVRDNGGDVVTIALKADLLNPALDAATIGGTDARGKARGVDLIFIENGGNSDLGAFELQDQVVVPPTFTSSAAFAVMENQSLVGTVVTEDDKAGVTFDLVNGGPDAGLFSIEGTTGILTFKSPPDFEAPSDTGGNNVYDIIVSALDSDLFLVRQSLTVTVTDVNEAPVANAATISGDEDTVISGALSASDDDGDTFSFSLMAAPSNGVAVVNANGLFTFTPTTDFNGTDSFTFRVSDGVLSDVGTATITVNPVDEPFDPVDPVDPVDPPAPTGPTEGDDILLGTALNDTINALAGNDKVSGLAGDDLLLGGGGDDSILGAAGDDRLRGNGGDDTVKGGSGDDNLKGNGGEDVIRGNGGDDVIRAGGGADNVKGGGGADLIFGGGGADQLNGGGGADTIRGNGGDDTLKGNGGADVFQFRASDRNDTISDFRQGQDKIQIQSGANAFERLNIEQDGRDVLIGFGAGQVRVLTDNAGAFDESDFIF